MDYINYVINIKSLFYWAWYEKTFYCHVLYLGNLVQCTMSLSLYNVKLLTNCSYFRLFVALILTCEVNVLTSKYWGLTSYHFELYLARLQYTYKWLYKNITPQKCPVILHFSVIIGSIFICHLIQYRDKCIVVVLFKTELRMKCIEKIIFLYCVCH